MTPELWGLLTWSVQVALIVTAGALAAPMLAGGKSRLLFWQGLLVTVLLLPWIEPWRSVPLVVATSGAATPIAAVVCGSPAGCGAASGASMGFRWIPTGWILLIAAGAVARVVWMAAGLLRLHRYRKAASRLGSPLPFATGPARWYASDTIPGPVTYGWLHPSILVPERVLRLPAAMRDAILSHEWAHVRRRDWLFVMAEELVRAVLWFHPAVWFVLGRIQLAREHAVDSEVVRLTGDRDGYLDALVEAAALGVRPDLAPAPLFLRKRHLAVRVAAVLKEVPMSRSRRAARMAAAGVATLLAVAGATMLMPFVSAAQTVVDDPGITVDAGGPLLHRPAVRNLSGVEGTLTLEATLNQKGEVTDAHVLSGPEELRKDALSSVLQWHYQPGVRLVQITMRFEPGALTPSPVPGPGAIARLLQDEQQFRGGGRGGPPQGPTTVRSIEIQGFSPEAEQELRRELSGYKGGTVSQEDMPRIAAIVSNIDEHAMVSLRRGPSAGESTLRVSLGAFPGIPLIGGGVATANRINSVAPMYPPLAKAARIQGTVQLQALIGQDGTIKKLELLSGNPLLAQAAKDAVTQWTYKPTLTNGQPTEVQTTVSVNFSLDQ